MWSSLLFALNSWFLFSCKLSKKHASLKHAKIYCTLAKRLKKKKKKALVESLMFNCLLSDLVVIAQYFTGGEKHKRTWLRLSRNLTDGTSSFLGIGFHCIDHSVGRITKRIELGRTSYSYMHMLRFASMW